MAKKSSNVKDLSSAVSALQKVQPSAVADDPYDTPDLGVVSTGSIAADMVTTVTGFPRGRISEVSGWEGSGKTTLLLNAMAAAQRSGLTCAFFDLERALDLKFAQNIGLGFDQKSAVYLQPETMEATADAVEAMLEGGVDLVAVDSVSALIPKSVMEGESAMDTEAVALRARKLHQWIPRLVAKARESKTAVVLINQLREVIPVNTFAARFGPKTRTSGGSAMRFWPSVRIQCKLVRKGNITRKAQDPFKVSEKDVEISVANEHLVETDKNKVGAAFREAPFWIRYDEVTGVWGVDNLQTLIDMSLVQGFIEKRGAIYEVESTNVKGLDELYKLVLGNKELAERLASQLGIQGWSTLYAPNVVTA